VTQTCRDEILRAFDEMAQLHDKDVFALNEIVTYMLRRGTSCKESTIRTHITSRLCINAPDHHAVVYPDLERVGRGMYRRTTR
jgi:hypothetical protein